jgi:16S rRNA (uracil1498-N3)-methyltransferase
VSRARLIVSRCPETGARVVITGTEAAHARARRLSPGDPVTLMDGTGMESRGRLLRSTSSRAEIEIDEVVRAAEPEIELTLLLSALRTERMAWVAEKATELSASRIVVVASERAQAFRSSQANVARLGRVAREAAKQCESARWPRIEGPVALEDVWREPAAHRFLLDLEGESFPEALAPGALAILVGPEGGWTAAERGGAVASGWRVLRLPAGKLRAETAAVAALVLARAALERGRIEKN